MRGITRFKACGYPACITGRLDSIVISQQSYCKSGGLWSVRVLQHDSVNLFFIVSIVSKLNENCPKLTFGSQNVIHDWLAVLVALMVPDQSGEVVQDVFDSGHDDSATRVGWKLLKFLWKKKNKKTKHHVRWFIYVLSTANQVITAESLVLIKWSWHVHTSQEDCVSVLCVSGLELQETVEVRWLMVGVTVMIWEELNDVPLLTGWEYVQQVGCISSEPVNQKSTH